MCSVRVSFNYFVKDFPDALCVTKSSIVNLLLWGIFQFQRRYFQRHFKLEINLLMAGLGGSGRGEMETTVLEQQ